MIVKEKLGPVPTDRNGKSGHDTEIQMAFYLRRAFAEAKDIFVFNDLKFERNGETAQIDHLVMHRFGFVLIESKSVYGKIEVNPQLEFVRVYGRNRYAMRSPIQQVKLQADLFRNYLNDNKSLLRRKIIFGLKQTSFAEDRFRTLVAISDTGEIECVNCSPLELVKADSVADCIHEFIARHQYADSFSGTVRSIIGDKNEAKQIDKDLLVPFTDDEIDKLTVFLLDKNLSKEATAIVATEKQLPPLITKNRIGGSSPASESQVLDTVMRFNEFDHAGESTCQHCGCQSVSIVYGKYGYYFKCVKCQGNTKIVAKCQNCSAKARLRKQGLSFFAICDACRNESLFHSNNSEVSDSTKASG